MVTPSILVCLGIALGAAPPQSANPVEPTQNSVDSAEIDKAIAALDYEEAREMLLIALAQDGLSDDKRLELHMKAGVVDRVLNQNVEAKMHFQEALLLNPTAELPQGQAPKIQTFFNLVKSEFERQRPSVAPPAPSPTVENGAEPVVSPRPEAGTPWTAFGVVGLGAATALLLAPALLGASAASYYLLVANDDAAAGGRNAGRTAWVGLAGASAIAMVAGAAVAAIGGVMVANAE